MKGILKYKSGWIIEFGCNEFVVSGDDVLFGDVKLIHSKEYEFELDKKGIAHIIIIPTQQDNWDEAFAKFLEITPSWLINENYLLQFFKDNYKLTKK